MVSLSGPRSQIGASGRGVTASVITALAEEMIFGPTRNAAFSNGACDTIIFQGVTPCVTDDSPDLSTAEQRPDAPVCGCVLSLSLLYNCWDSRFCVASWIFQVMGARDLDSMSPVMKTLYPRWHEELLAGHPAHLSLINIQVSLF